MFSFSDSILIFPLLRSICLLVKRKSTSSPSLDLLINSVRRVCWSEAASESLMAEKFFLCIQMGKRLVPELDCVLFSAGEISAGEISAGEFSARSSSISSCENSLGEDRVWVAAGFDCVSGDSAMSATRGFGSNCRFSV